MTPFSLPETTVTANSRSRRNPRIVPGMQTRRDFLHSAAALTGGAFALGSIPGRHRPRDGDRSGTRHDVSRRRACRDPHAGEPVVRPQLRRAARCPRFSRPARACAAKRQPGLVPDRRTGRHLRALPSRHHDTNATWIGGLPHTWPDQIDARNGGKYDKWLIAKPKQRSALHARPLHARRHSVLLRARRRVHGLRPGVLFVAHRNDGEPSVPLDRHHSARRDGCRHA